MFRNQYDNDITTWSPQGRIHQVEYAMEAIKQGAASVGVKTKDFAVLAAVKRSASKLAGYQEKIFEVDSHVAMSIAGLASDGRSLRRFLQSECMNSRWAFDEPLPMTRLVASVGEKLQRCTQSWGRRPYGVGLLLAGYDDHGAHIYQVDPSANYFECKSMAIGARSQSARTYLERHMDAIANSDKESLVRHALLALRECLPTDDKLDENNTTLAIVGKDHPLKICNDATMAEYLALIDDESAAAPEATMEE